MELTGEGNSTVGDGIHSSVKPPSTQTPFSKLSMATEATVVDTSSSLEIAVKTTTMDLNTDKAVTELSKIIPTTLADTDTTLRNMPTAVSLGTDDTTVISHVLNAISPTGPRGNTGSGKGIVGVAEGNMIDPLDVAKDITIKNVICIATVLGLILVVLILARKDLRRSRICWFILSGMLGVFIKVLVVYPMQLTLDGEAGWVIGEKACYAYLFLSHLASACTALTVILLSFDRFIFAYCEETYRRKINVVVTILLILATWIFSCGLASLITFYLGQPRLEYDHVIKHSSCQLDKSRIGRYWLLVDFLSFAAIPAGLNLLILLFIFGSCCRRRQLFYEDRSPMVNAILLLIILNVLYIALVCPTHSVPFINKFFITNRRAHYHLHARSKQVVSKGCDIAEAAFYGLFPAMLFVLVSDIRGALASCCRKGICCTSDPDERKPLNSNKYR